LKPKTLIVDIENRLVVNTEEPGDHAAAAAIIPPKIG